MLRKCNFAKTILRYDMIDWLQVSIFVGSGLFFYGSFMGVRYLLRRPRVKIVGSTRDSGWDAWNNKHTIDPYAQKRLYGFSEPEIFSGYSNSVSGVYHAGPSGYSGCYNPAGASARNNMDADEKRRIDREKRRTEEQQQNLLLLGACIGAGGV